MTARKFNAARALPAACWLAAAMLAAGSTPAPAQNVQPPAAAPAANVPAAQSAQPPAAQQTAPAPAAPQQPASPAASSASAFPPQPPPAEKRGFLNDFGRWWTDSVADFNKKSSDAARDAATATQQAVKDATDAMVHLSTPSKVIEVQQTCPVAGNGAADCATAATNACKGKGFSSGQPLDVRTAEKCNASLWVSGQNPTSADCPVETVVLRVACQ